VPLNEFYVNQLPIWLTNDTIPLSFRSADVLRNAAEIRRFAP
jgi:hypothetical protein